MKLKNKDISVCIWSDNYEKLAKWYEDALGYFGWSKQQATNTKQPQYQTATAARDTLIVSVSVSG